MPLVSMPNGEVIEVDENITPEALKQLEKQFPAKRRPKPIPIDQPKKSSPLAESIRGQQRRQLYNLPFGLGYLTRGLDAVGGAGREAVDTLQDFGSGAVKGATLSFDDELAGAASFVSGNGYRKGRDAAREVQIDAAERSPVANTFGELVGSLLVPVGGAAKAVGTLGTRGVQIADKLRSAPAVVQGIGVGAGQGALNAAGNANELSDVPTALVDGGAVGGLVGGALGGAVQLGQRGLQIYNRTRPENAEREAYEIIARQLGIGDGSTKFTPATARAEIQAADRAGGDARVMDLTPGMQAIGANLSRKVDLGNAPALYQMGVNRTASRRTRFGEMVEREAAPPQGGFDAMERADVITGGRKAAGKRDYAEGGVLDSPINPTPELQSYLSTAPKQVQDAFKAAYDDMLLRDLDPSGIASPNGIFSHIPNLRTFDYVKRAFDQKIKEAGVGSPTAQGLSFQLDKLKGVLAKANPNDTAYQTMLLTQRDAFQKAKALEIGEGVIRRLGTEPRKVLKELRAMPAEQQTEARIGILDALINPSTKAARANPLKQFQDIMIDKSQRKTLEFAFGGKGNLGRFERWVKREMKAQRGDSLISGNQSITGMLKSVDDATDSGLPGGQDIMQGALAGYGFGGPTGMLSNVAGKLGRIASGTSKFTQDEIAKILMSKGENLVKGTEAAALYRANRQRSNARRVRAAAKVGQQMVTGFVG